MSEAGPRFEHRPPRPTVVRAAETTWSGFRAIWRPLLDTVYETLAGFPDVKKGENIMLYVPAEGGGLHFEVGVEADGAFDRAGEVVRSELPGGEVAVAVHRGPYENLGVTNEAIQAFCREQGRLLAGPSWEVYGDWYEDSSRLETEVCYLLR